MRIIISALCAFLLIGAMYYFLGFMTQPEISVKKMVKLEKTANQIRELDCRQPDDKSMLQWAPNKTYSKEVLLDLKFRFYPSLDERSFGAETPLVGVKLDNGWLLGSNRGEWGGRLVYKEGDKVIKIIDDNIEDIYPFESGYIVTAGLAHMGMNRGSIYFIEHKQGEKFKVKKVHELPSSPTSSWMITENEILVKFTHPRAVIVNSTGSIEVVVCQN